VSSQEFANEINERFRLLFDPYVLALIGVLFQIFGAIFLSFEALGKEWFTKRFNTIGKFSKWYTKSFKRMTLIIISIFALLTFGLIFNLKILVALFFPVIFFMGFFSVLVDHPKYYEKWVLKKSSEGRIGPIGFIVLAIGAFLQMLSILIQIGRSS